MRVDEVQPQEFTEHPSPQWSSFLQAEGARDWLEVWHPQPFTRSPTCTRPWAHPVILLPFLEFGPKIYLTIGSPFFAAKQFYVENHRRVFSIVWVESYCPVLLFQHPTQCGCQSFVLSYHLQGTQILPSLTSLIRLRGY